MCWTFTIFQIDQYFDFVSLIDENTTSHKYVVRNERSLGLFQKLLGKSVLIPSKNLFNGSMKSKSTIQ